jgi:hypothetical protein
VCKNEVTRLSEHQTFTFSAQSDKWEDSWTRRSGIPISHFEGRWNALARVPYTGSLEEKMNIDPNPHNPTFQVSTGPSKIGGQELIDEMTRSIHQHRVASMARLFLKTCPGDWDSGWGPLFHGMLLRAVEHRASYEELKEVSAAIRFRWEVASIADQLVEEFNLPVPSGECCILWNRMKWSPGKERKCKGYGKAWGLLDASNIKPNPAADQGPHFVRFLFYMTAAVAEADLPETSCCSLVQQLVERMNHNKAFYRERAMADPIVLQHADNWLKSIGRKMRQSLHSP